jgi:hypothetical protein
MALKFALLEISRISGGVGDTPARRGNGGSAGCAPIELVIM